VSHAGDLAGLLRLNRGLEEELVEHYADAMRFCVLVGDGDSEAFFRDLLAEERQHGEDLNAWLASLAPAVPMELERATF
jgi:bacterioferritin